MFEVYGPQNWYKIQIQLQVVSPAPQPPIYLSLWKCGVIESTARDLVFVSDVMFQLMFSNADLKGYYKNAFSLYGTCFPKSSNSKNSSNNIVIMAIISVHSGTFYMFGSKVLTEMNTWHHTNWLKSQYLCPLQFCRLFLQWVVEGPYIGLVHVQIPSQEMTLCLQECRRCQSVSTNHWFPSVRHVQHICVWLPRNTSMTCMHNPAKIK